MACWPAAAVVQSLYTTQGIPTTSVAFKSAYKLFLLVVHIPAACSTRHIAKLWYHCTCTRQLQAKPQAAADLQGTKQLTNTNTLAGSMPSREAS